MISENNWPGLNEIFWEMRDGTNTHGWAESQREHHKEEEDGPERCDGHLWEGFWVQDEHQAWTWRRSNGSHNDVIKWKHFPRHCPLWGEFTGEFPSQQWRGALMFSFICAWINGWVNNHEAGDLRRHHAHYNVTVMVLTIRRHLGHLQVLHVRHITKHWEHGKPGVQTRHAVDHGHHQRVSGIARVTWSWWRHQMKIFSASLAFCAGNSPVTGEFPAQMPVTRSCDVFFDLRLNKRLSKQSIRRWFGTPSC